MAGGMLGEGAGVVPTNFNGEEAEQEPNVSPEEQGEYDMFVQNAMELLYTKDGKPLPEAINRLSTGNNPVEALAQASVWATMLVENSAEQSGKQISDDVLFHGGQEILEQLAELAEAAGVHKFEEDEMEGAFYRALDMWREANTGGRFNPEEATAQFMELNQADEEGHADDLLPGYSALVNRQSAKMQREQGEA